MTATIGHSLVIIKLIYIYLLKTIINNSENVTINIDNVSKFSAWVVDPRTMYIHNHGTIL